MFTQVLDAPISELAVGDEVDIGNDFFDRRPLGDPLVRRDIRTGSLYLFFLDAILEDVLHDQATGLTQGHLMPHTSKSLIDLGHDLRWFAVPAKLQQLLPDMTRIAMDDGIRDATKQFFHHVCLVIFGHRIERFLDHMAAKRIHTQRENMTVDRMGNRHDLFGRAVFEATLNEEIAEAIHHEWVCLADNGLNNVEFLRRRSDLELLLQENRCLLIVVAHDLVDNVLPVTRNRLVQKTTIIHRLQWSRVRESVE